MDFVVIPQALLMFYGALVLGCGTVLGFILGRNLPRKRLQPDPPLLLERRLATLESELEATQTELGRLKNESQFLRELYAPRRDLKIPGQEGKRLSA